jgi:tRNA (guanosine-2'-O-)-methyltransferase
MTLPMRRNSEGVTDVEGLLPAFIRQAESHDPDACIAALEPMILPERAARMREVLSRRIDAVSVLFDAPVDPFNGAAVIRSCEAFGVSALHVIERAKPFLTATSVTKGSHRWVDVHAYQKPASAIARLKADGYILVAADAGGELLPEDLANIPKLALVLGNEHDGVSEELLSAADKRVRVPMRGFVESLNVSATAAILLSHATKGRPGDMSESDLKRLYARGLYLTLNRAEDILRALGV